VSPQTVELTPLQARRAALAAQGFTARRPERVKASHVNAVAQRLGLFQIDSVNVLQRAHYMPLYSRVGPYDIALLHRAFGRAPRRLFEYWAHEAALVDVGLYPALRYRMASGENMWGGPRRIAEENPQLVAEILAEVQDRGPLTAREIDGDLRAERTGWGWNWSAAKTALEYLFHTGQVTSAGRTPSFERRYDVPERVLPRAALDAPALPSDDAHRVLVAHAARALGVASQRCLRDYFRMRKEPVAQAIAELVDAGELVPVRVKGWSQPVWIHRAASVPRAVRARALLSPFDPLVFERARTEALFGFRYRIEIYVPEHKRIHGYYVLPFLLGDRLVGRVDLKADRAGGRLIVRAAFAEPSAPPETASELASELGQLAAWLELSDIIAPERGDLAAELSAALP